MLKREIERSNYDSYKNTTNQYVSAMDVSFLF